MQQIEKLKDEETKVMHNPTKVDHLAVKQQADKNTTFKTFNANSSQ